MTSEQIAVALGDAERIEEEARACWRTTTDLPDKDAVLIVMRQAVTLRRSLERWIGKRALREQLKTRKVG